MSLPQTASAAASGLSQQATQSTGLLLTLLVIALISLAAFSWQLRARHTTRRRERESALRAVTAQHAQLIDLLPVAMFSFSHTKGFISMSEGIRRLLPVSADAIIANPDALLTAIHPDDAPRLAPLFAATELPATFEWHGRRHPEHQGDEPTWLHLSARADVTITGEAILAGVILDVTPLKSTQLSLERTQEQLRQLSARREDEREREYRRIAREFHDELGQLLTGARLRLQVLGRLSADEQHTTIAEIESMLIDAYRSVKAITAELRPPALNLGLVAAIEWQAEQSFAHQPTQVTLALRTPPANLTDNAMTTLFRIVQEAFTNIVKCAHARNVHVSLRNDEHGLYLTIADDGTGFEPQGVDTACHFGLVGMRERALALNGTLDVDSAPGEGTRIHVRIPLNCRQPS